MNSNPQTKVDGHHRHYLGGSDARITRGGFIDRKCHLGLMSDLAGRVVVSIDNAADDLAAGRV